MTNVSRRLFLSGSVASGAAALLPISGAMADPAAPAGGDGRTKGVVEVSTRHWGLAPPPGAVRRRHPLRSA